MLYCYTLDQSMGYHKNSRNSTKYIWGFKYIVNVTFHIGKWLIDYSINVGISGQSPVKLDL